MDIIDITSLSEPGADLFASLTEAQLRQRREAEQGLFIVESPKVIRVALDQGMEPVALLCERRHLTGDAEDIVCRMKALEARRADGSPDMKIYTGERDVLARLTGYQLTRGVLCAMRRPSAPPLEEVCREAHRLVVLHGVVDTTNIGAIFRSAAALGIDGVLLTTDSCDPLNRRAVRVSMGSVFLVPWTWIDAHSEPVASQLRRLGFHSLAMALDERALPLDHPRLKSLDRLALVMGTEGDGLPRKAIDCCDDVVRIPMQHGVDSLNVAAASAVAFWELRGTSNEAPAKEWHKPLS